MYIWGYPASSTPHLEDTYSLASEAATASLLQPRSEYRIPVGTTSAQDMIQPLPYRILKLVS